MSSPPRVKGVCKVSSKQNHPSECIDDENYFFPQTKKIDSSKLLKSFSKLAAREKGWRRKVEEEEEEKFSKLDHLVQNFFLCRRCCSHQR
jgi:hypothetical protein